MEKIKKKPLNLTIHPKVRTLAEKLMAALGHGDFSGLFEDLVRREYEKRVEIIKIQEPATQSETVAAMMKPLEEERDRSRKRGASKTSSQELC